MSHVNILDEYVHAAPSDQTALDLFKGEWSSIFPATTQLTATPGNAPLFEDGRIAWVAEKFGFFGKSVLELGPLEGGHSYMAQMRGARRVLAIEANARAYVKCLIVKEIFNLDRVSFKLGDFNAYLSETKEKFDICIASGVLYHCVDPISTIANIARVSDNVFFWTHHYDANVIQNSPNLKKFFTSPETTVTVNGVTYPARQKHYNDALGWQGFCGGSQPHALWISKAAILDSLKTHGFKSFSIEFEQMDHPNGPAFAVCASR